MKDFYQWLEAQLAERGARTGLGIYPDSYHAGQYPPLAQTPVAGGAAGALISNHPNVIKNVQKPKKKRKKKSKRS